jgi:hypothetical protein
MNINLYIILKMILKSNWAMKNPDINLGMIEWKKKL